MNYKSLLIITGIILSYQLKAAQTSFSTMSAKAGENVTIEFPVEPQSRFYWRLESMEPDNALVLQRQEFVPTDEGSDKTAFVFKGLRSGVAKAIFARQIIPTEVGMPISTERHIYQIAIAN
jgi:predicted secreted protein